MLIYTPHYKDLLDDIQ